MQRLKVVVLLGYIVTGMCFRPPTEEILRQSGVEDVQDALARLVPGGLVELESIRNDEVLQAIGARSRQLLVTLLNTPMQLGEELLQQQMTKNIEILREDINNSVQGVVACGRHPFGLLGDVLRQFHVVEDTEDHIEDSIAILQIDKALQICNYAYKHLRSIWISYTHIYFKSYLILIKP